MYKIFFLHMFPQIILNFLISISQKLCNNIVGILALLLIFYFVEQLQWVVQSVAYFYLNGATILQQIKRLNTAFHTKMGIYMVCSLHLFTFFLVLSMYNEIKKNVYE